MRCVACFLIFICLSSCDYFNKKKVNSEDIVSEELQTFNWNDVDEYPSFSSCDTSEFKQDRVICFSTTLTNHITTQLSGNSIVVTEDVQDTIQLKFQISELGVIKILDIQSKAKTQNAIPNIDSLLVRSLESLPKIFPAIKRGQQVRTEFILPIVIRVN